jgi:hypothetical protein
MLGSGPCRNGSGVTEKYLILKEAANRFDCRKTCESLEGCVGVEHSKSSPNDCELHFYDVNHVDPDCDVQCWKRKEGAPRTKKWKLVGNGACRTEHESGYSWIQESATNLKECQDACASVDVCVAFEKSASGGCELHMAAITKVNPDDGVVCYSIDPVPTGDTSPSSNPKPAAAPETPSQNTVTKQWTLLGEGECRPSSGQPETGQESDAENVLQCWQMCDQSETCLAYEWTEDTAWTWGGSCRLYTAANHVSPKCGVKCWGLQSINVEKEWRKLGDGACRNEGGKYPKVFQALTNVSSSGACQYLCASSDSCTAFEYSSQSGGCELHKSHITNYGSDDGVQCWCDTSICGTESVGNEQSPSNPVQKDSNTLTIVIIILVVIVVVGLVGLGAAIFCCSWKPKKSASASTGAAKVVGQPVQEAGAGA